MQLTKNFNINEFACKDGTAVPTELVANAIELAANLQALRNELGKPIIINSAYRSPTHNALVGGSPNSQHLLCKAADLRTDTPRQLAETIFRLIAAGKMKEGGVGVYSTFVHYDIRGTKARW